MKGIILAGGTGTRLYPLTLVTSKQLLPVYNKPMIYYPLSTLMLAKIREILIISTKEDTPRIRRLLGDGSQFGISLKYAVQKSPEGLTQAFTIGKRFGYYVEDPDRYGIMEFKKVSNDKDFGIKVISVEEKPDNPKSNYAIVGLYFYPTGVSKLAKNVKPSKRGELEITTLNDMYLKDGRLNAQLLGRGYTWMDAGTFDSLRRATNFVCMIEQYQGMTISAPEEIAYRCNWIDKEQLKESAEKYGNSPYGEHLRAVLEDRIIR